MPASTSFASTALLRPPGATLQSARNARYDGHFPLPHIPICTNLNMTRVWIWTPKLPPSEAVPTGREVIVGRCEHTQAVAKRELRRHLLRKEKIGECPCIRSTRLPW
ncbi:hypothetical protein GGX14DRAFT_389609 [Mycena pura]|uniref:Uncharacterized protein n=1 Tax=Mycena pura TaxID=153505 RepID=A0AAD6YGG0_9AGAR|nr:hypothetical protein GGX14DRAFT_389609 [Mycena pura]